MSRSYRKSPVKSWANSGSMKAWRTEYNQRHRHAQKQLLKKFLDNNNWDNYIARVIREDSSIYDSPMDSCFPYSLKPHEEKDYNPRTEMYDRFCCGKTSLERWKEIFRK